MNRRDEFAKAAAGDATRNAAWAAERAWQNKKICKKLGIELEAK